MFHSVLGWPAVLISKLLAAQNVPATSDVRPFDPMGYRRCHRSPTLRAAVRRRIEGAGGSLMRSRIAATVALAKYPNVSVKVSASPGLSRQPYPFRDVAEHIKRVFDAYGPQRSYWGTDITNSYAKASYRQRITHFTEELSFLSETDKDWVMGRAILQRLRWT
jgi:hypothetical protein